MKTSKERKVTFTIKELIGTLCIYFAMGGIVSFIAVYFMGNIDFYWEDTHIVVWGFLAMFMISSSFTNGLLPPTNSDA